MKLLCDEMLKGLAKWLRAAGYDTETAPEGAVDRSLVDRAREEGRILLTRDRELLDYKAPDTHIVVLQCNHLADCMDELHEQLDIDWLHAPFTRCLKCNTPLVEAGADQWQDVPESSRAAAHRLLYCPACEQLFWDGSHVARMRERLERAASDTRS
jgi:uncharacterized protein with PIN domain